MSPPAETGRPGTFGDPWGEDTLSQLLEELKGSLPGMRWFAEKSLPLTGLSVVDHAPLIGGPSPVGWFLLEATFPGRAPSYYSAFYRREEDALRPAEDHPDLAEYLLAGLRAASRVPTERGSLTFRPSGPADGGEALPARVQQVRQITSEQSNTSVVIDGRTIHKHLRRIVPGENPDVEVPEYLWSRSPFRNVPRPLGSLAYSGPKFPLALVGTTQVFVPNEGDLWTGFRKELAGAGGTPPPSVLSLVTELASVTGQLHVALASAPADLTAFSPEPVREADVARWQASWDTTYERARAELSQARDRLPPPVRDLAEKVGRCLPQLPARTALRWEEGLRDSLRTRIHGDYHLGQVMRTRTGLIILDFEGEPLRSLEERRAKQSPLKDVAGMLRSLDYAAHAAVRAPFPGSARPLEDPSLPERSSREMQERFLERYWAVAGAARPRWVDPKDPALPRLLRFHVTEKALYELSYELQYRPGWVDIPLRALLRATGAGPGEVPVADVPGRPGRSGEDL